MTTQRSGDGASARALWMPVAAYMALIFLISAISPPPSLPAQTDKGVHALSYAGLAALLVRALAGGSWRGVTFRVMVLATLIAACYGVTDEWHQRFVRGRTYDYFDMAADATGAGLAACLIGLWGKMKHVL